MTNNFNLSENLMKAIELLNYSSFTDVQNQAIPEILAQKDVIVKSQTGSGKTASFVIPICEHIVWEENAVQALVLTPTRELAIQVKDDVFNIGRFKRIKCSALYGRDSFVKQSKELKQKTHIAVGTPGRVIDHIERQTLNTDNIKYLVIDEADEMLAMGFIEQVEEIIDALPKNRVTVLLSATFSSDIQNIAKKYMKNPTKIEIEQQISTIDKVSQVFYHADEDKKGQLLRDITTVENPESCIIFCNTQANVDDIDDFLYKNGYTCDKIHGGMEQVDRTRIMNNFKRGVFRYLIATDVAARGIDVDDISLVINFDMPKKSETYVHRIGRTGRIGKGGKAITFVSERGMNSFDELQEFLNKTIDFEVPPTKTQVEQAKTGFDKKMDKKPQVRELKGSKLSENITKIHINAGKKTKMRPVDIVGTLCSIDGMTAADIGIINILDISTFVEVLNGKGDMVHKVLQTKPIKGRLRTVSLVEND
ncbi:MAG: DEAD/DEAH box helicase [Clostridia bacterium]